MTSNTLRKASITLSPPITAPRPISLQLLLGIHQPGLHPHAILPVILDTLAVQQVRQRTLDLLVDVFELVLLLLNFAQDTLVNDGREGGAAFDHLWSAGPVG